MATTCTTATLRPSSHGGHAPRQGPGDGLFDDLVLAGIDRAQVEQGAVPLHAGDDGGIAPAQRGPVRSPGRARPAEGISTPGSVPPPVTDDSSTTSAPTPLAAAIPWRC